MKMNVIFSFESLLIRVKAAELEKTRKQRNVLRKQSYVVGENHPEGRCG